MQLIIGIIIGFAIWHYWPSESQNVAKEANVVIHNTAKRVADATEPTLFEQAKQKVEEYTK